MIEQLLNHIERHKLCKTTDKILLAVSGGLDSMVMLHLFRKAGFKVGVVHCNFQLRGAESDADEEFVRATCGANIPFYVKRFDTQAFAEARGVSIQMAARELRYSYFNEVVNQFGYTAIGTAHHLNDTLETVLLNLIRGSGIDGLTGIAVRNDRIIRPMLFATRQMIAEYALQEKLVWREDASNNSVDYQRNFIRLKVLPLLKEINPNVEETFRDTHERLAGARHINNRFIEQFCRSAVSEKNGNASISKGLLMETGVPAVLLWEIIKRYEFNFDQCKEIIEDHQPGKIFLSPSYKLTIDRDTYMIQRRTALQFAPVSINRNNNTVKSYGGSLIFEERSKESFSLQKSSSLAQLDAEKIQYPLLWRLWQPGDFFTPLGMRQHKKISDFLVDRKVSLPEKEKITVLESAGIIVWVVGLRIHDDFKVTDQTKRILSIRFQPE